MRSVEASPTRLIGYVSRYEVDGKNFHTQSAKLIKHREGIVYSELLMKWNDIISLFVSFAVDQQSLNCSYIFSRANADPKHDAGTAEGSIPCRYCSPSSDNR